MVEPAIAISAAAIATLRPMFKNFFVFARKRFDSNIDDEEKPSGGSQHALTGKEYSAEFAEMLGLSRYGVTTIISAGGSELEQETKRRGLSRLGVWGEKQPAESQTELHRVESEDEAGAGGLHWNMGIKKTTIITYD